MRISEINLYEIEIPPIPPIAKYFPKIYDITLCRIRTDDGLTGWGEYQGSASTHQHTAQALTDTELTSIDPYDQPDAFTCALLDITGQAFGLPLNRFFGPQVRKRVPVSYWSCHMEPEETAAEAATGARLGFSNHKLKARRWDIVETVQAIKKTAGPDYTVGVDPNTSFEYVPIGAQLADKLESVGTVSVFEDPVHKHNLDWYRLLREKTHIPIALHLGSPVAVLSALKAECVDYLNLGGNAVQVRKAAALAEAADVPCWVQMGGLCLGVLAAYSVHLQSTLNSAVLPCDELPFTRIADVLGGSLTMSDGHFDVPTGPGLGVEVDMEVVERYRVG